MLTLILTFCRNSVALSFFNWVCWIVPDNIVVNQLFGYSSGLVRLELVQVRTNYLITHVGNEFDHFRLVSNCVHRITFGHPMVG